MTWPGEWREHPSGIRSRALPDGWPAIDPDHGFRPPFAVDRIDLGQYETVEVFPTLLQAARCASWCNRRLWSGVIVEINDQDRVNL